MSTLLSIAIPCLNEADTLSSCLRKAQAGLKETGLEAEIIVADDGSTDASQQIAENFCARVISVPTKGYGAAPMGGIAAFRGQYILMGDADDSNDFGEIPKFVRKIAEGFDLVQGCPLPAGGGKVASGAMPWSHRWIGNPMFFFMVRTWFHAPTIRCRAGACRHELIALETFRKSFLKNSPRKLLLRVRLCSTRSTYMPATITWLCNCILCPSAKRVAFFTIFERSMHIQNRGVQVAHCLDS